MGIRGDITGKKALDGVQDHALLFGPLLKGEAGLVRGDGCGHGIFLPGAPV